jgi:Flp pilus assembly protein TadD
MAAGSLEVARKLDPRNAEIRLNLAYAMSREHRMADAIAEMETAVNLSPADSALRLGLGNLFVLAKDLTRASEQYSKLRETDPIARAKLYDASPWRVMS